MIINRRSSPGKTPCYEIHRAIRHLKEAIAKLCKVVESVRGQERGYGEEKGGGNMGLRVKQGSTDPIQVVCNCGGLSWYHHMLD